MKTARPQRAAGAAGEFGAGAAVGSGGKRPGAVRKPPREGDDVRGITLVCKRRAQTRGAGRLKACLRQQAVARVVRGDVALVLEPRRGGY